MNTPPPQTHFAQTTLKNAQAVCLDVDSTVIIDEAIDILAKHCNVGCAVSEWTQKAMGGGVTFRQALIERLDIIKPTLQQIESCLLEHPPNFTPGVEQFIKILQKQNIHVFLITGGFHQMIAPIAKLLNINPKENVYANRLLFDEITGHYIGFDENEPTSDTGGKAKAVSMIKNKTGFERIVMIGDGITDAEAKPPATTFIGFGGNVVREKVVQAADWFIYDFEQLNVLFNEST